MRGSQRERGKDSECLEDFRSYVCTAIAMKSLSSTPIQKANVILESAQAVDSEEMDTGLLADSGHDIQRRL